MDISRELEPADREVVAARLLLEQRTRFKGVKRAAYTAAGVNSQTWENAIGATRVRPDRLVQIVTSLWPESNGDWDAVPAEPTKEGDRSFSWAEVAAGQPATQQQIMELLARIEQLERAMAAGPPPPPGYVPPITTLPGVDVLVVDVLRRVGGDYAAALELLDAEGPNGSGDTVWQGAMVLLTELMPEDNVRELRGASRVAYEAARKSAAGAKVDKARHAQDQVEQGSQDRGGMDPA